MNIDEVCRRLQRNGCQLLERDDAGDFWTTSNGLTFRIPDPDDGNEIDYTILLDALVNQWVPVSVLD